MTENEHDDDERARRERAQRLRQTIEDMAHGGPPRPRTPREFTEERAREAAAEERKRLEGTGDGEDED